MIGKILACATVVGMLGIPTEAVTHSGGGDPFRTSEFRAILETLNAEQGSEVTGRANFVVREWEDRAELDVRIRASNLEPGRAHLQHIHGLFAEDPTPPNDPSATDGVFFTGEGGTAIDSRVPQFPGDDFNGDGYITFIEGLPAYGPVILNLPLSQLPHPANGVSPVASANMLIEGALGPNPSADDVEMLLRSLFPTPGADGELDYAVTFEFDLTNQDARRQFNNFMPLNKRVLVLHGMTIDTNEVNLRDFELANVTSDGFDITSPVAAGELSVVPEPAMATLIGLGAVSSLVAMTRRRREERAVE